MDFLKSVYKFITKENLFHETDHLLVAVSGGVDSMVLIDVLLSLNYRCQVAHVNYGLRESDSDRDELLVREFCALHQIPIHVKKLARTDMERMKAGNLQENTRNLRYAWFHELLEAEKLNFVCTGHQANDRIETFILHLMRGSGVRGLSSLKPARGLVRRPLLQMFRTQITSYAKQNKVFFTVDQSNLQSDYDRNYIRHELLPVVEKRFGSALDNILETSFHLGDEALLLDYLAEKEKSKWIKMENNYIILEPLDALYKIDGLKSLMYRWLSPYGFTSASISDMISTAHQTGALFSSHRYEAVLDRNRLIVRPKSPALVIETTISEMGSYAIPGLGKLEIEECDDFEVDPSHLMEIVDKEKVNFPLKIRPWAPGDSFQPLGMKGHRKKLSDFFVDQHLSRFDKENIYVLCSGDNIIWIIGQRLDERFKVEENTRSFLRLELLEEIP